MVMAIPHINLTMFTESPHEKALNGSNHGMCRFLAVYMTRCSTLSKTEDDQKTEHDKDIL
jgi:hypothetical protein